MATIKPILNYQTNKHGHRTLILQILHHRKRAVVFSPYHLLPEEFNAKKGVAVAPNRTKVARARTAEINAYITTQIAELWTTIRDMEQSGDEFTSKEIIAAYRLRGDRRYVRTFVLSLCEEMERRGKHSTAGTYRSMLAAFERFAGGKDTRLSELTPVRLSGFEEYLKSILLQRNTITFYMRILRAVYNKARRAGLVGKGENPFEEVSFRIDKTRKRAIGVDTLRRIAGAGFGTRTWLTVARDLFLFSFHARGMSFVDMAYLKEEDVQGGVLRYTRHKTGQVFSVRVTEALQELIDRYAPCAPWMLPVMKGCVVGCESGVTLPDLEMDAPEKVLYGRYKYTLTNYWYYLGVISGELGTEKRLTFNVAAGHLVVIDAAALARYRVAENTIVLVYHPPLRLMELFSQCSAVYGTFSSEIIPILPPLWHWIDQLLTEHIEGKVWSHDQAHEQRRALARILMLVYPRRQLGELYAAFAACALGDYSSCRNRFPIVTTRNQNRRNLLSALKNRAAAALLPVVYLRICW